MAQIIDYSNFVVMKFALKLLFRKFKRLGYGLFLEKKWNIGLYSIKQIDQLYSLSSSPGKIPKVSNSYTFYADPFFSTDGQTIRAEALNAKTGLGEIIEIDSNSLHMKRCILKAHIIHTRILFRTEA